MNSRPPPTRPRKRLDAAAGPLVENFSLTAFLSFTWRLRLIRIPSPLPLPFPYLLLPTHLSRRLPPPPSLFHRSTPSSFSLSRSSRSYVYEWDSFEPRFTDSRARARTCTNTRIARIATSGTSACALSSLHDRVTPSSVALRTYVRTYEYTDDDRPTERPPSRAFQPTTTPVTKFDTNRRRRRFLPSCLPIGLRVRRVPKGGGGRRRTRFRSFGGCDSRNSSSRRPI